MTGTVTTLDTVNLAIYTANKSLAAPYIVVVTGTPIYPAIQTSILSVYSYSTLPTSSRTVSLVVVDPCTRTTIAA